MRHGRAKQARKTLQFFQRTVGLKAPYHVLLDGTFVVAFVQHNLPLQERLQRLLQITATQALVLVTTESVLRELTTLADKTADDKEKQAMLKRAHAWMVQHCAVQIKNVPAVSLDWATNNSNTQDYLADLSAAGRDCLSLVTAANGIPSKEATTTTTTTTTESSSSSSFPRLVTTTPPLLVASQDEALLHLCRQSARVPVIRLARGSVLLLEQPSQAAQAAQQATERTKWTVRGSVPEQEQVLVDLVKQKERQEQRRTSAVLPQHLQRRGKRKAKGPNPLSCKKKKDAALKTISKKS